jgi:hypothetical protein
VREAPRAILAEALARIGERTAIARLQPVRSGSR